MKQSKALWAELEGVRKDMEWLETGFDPVSNSTIVRVQREMYEKEHISEAFEHLPADQRLAIIRSYCRSCGEQGTSCSCYIDG